MLDGNLTNPGAECSYKKESYRKEIAALNNYICFSPEDMERFLKACNEQVDAIVTTCIVSAEETNLYCADDLSDFPLTWAEAINYICTSPRHFERLLKYCFR